MYASLKGVLPKFWHLVGLPGISWLLLWPLVPGLTTVTPGSFSYFTTHDFCFLCLTPGPNSCLHVCTLSIPLCLYPDWLATPTCISLQLGLLDLATTPYPTFYTTILVLIKAFFFWTLAWFLWPCFLPLSMTVCVCFSGHFCLLFLCWAGSTSTTHSSLRIESL